jgi:hypothetical protein
VIKKILSRFYLVAALLAVLLGACPIMQMSVAQGAETVVPKYGAPSYLDGSPVGGGDGYSQVYSAAGADYVVDTAAELKSALASAGSGDIVYVADGATITITSSNWYGNTSSDVDCGSYLKAGVTLAGGRGRDGVTGGIIKVSTSLQPTTFSVLIWCAGSGSRVTGLTLVGAQDGTTGGNMWCGVWAGDDANIDNNEIHGFGYGGVRVDRDVTDAWIHHNYIHHNRQSGYGYGVCVNANSIDHTASAIVEGNRFDYCRHVISGSRGRSSYTFRYNYLGANCTNTQIDVHGQNSGGDYLDKTSSGEYMYCAGENVKIYNNTSVCTTNPFVGIRGIPYSTGSVSVHNNWTYTTATQEWQLSSDRPKVRTINEQMDNMPGYGYIAPKGGGFVRMSAYDNWYGTTAPTSTNSAPATPAAPSGPASGVPGTSCTFGVRTTDPDGDTITYNTDWGDGTSYTTSGKTSGTTAYPTHSWAKSGTFAVKVKATDSKGNTSAWSPSLNVTIAGASTANQPPLTPAAPHGPVSGETGILCGYKVITTDPDGDTITYTIDWGDGTSHMTLSKTSGTAAYPGHTWTRAGTYAVKVRATDSKGNTSAWSPPVSLTITGAFQASAVTNSPPTAPVAPSGAASALTSSEYEYSAATTDPDGDYVSYTFDWGDGTVTTVPEVESGATTYASHVWHLPGTYVVKVTAADFEGAVSDWSDAITVTVVAQAIGDPPRTEAPDSSGAATGPATEHEVDSPTDPSISAENQGVESPAAPSSSAGDIEAGGSAPTSPDDQSVPSDEAHGSTMVLGLLTLVMTASAGLFVTAAIARESTPNPPGR